MKELSPNRTSTSLKKGTGSTYLKCRKSYQKKSRQTTSSSTGRPIIAVQNGDNCDDQDDSEDSGHHSNFKLKTTPTKDYSTKRGSANSAKRKLQFALSLLMGTGIGIMIGCLLPLGALNLPPKENTLSFSLQNLRSKYGGVKTIVFDELEAAVNMINRIGRPLSFVLAHRHNANVALSLSQDVAKLASIYLGNGTVFTITPDYLDTNVEAQDDFGKLLTEWRLDIEQSRVMVVVNLQAVPQHLAPMFHTLCDEFSPYVNRSLYLHTVDLGAQRGQQNELARPRGCEYCGAVEERLRKSWPALSDEVFEPLLTRIAGSVLTVG